MISLIYLTFTGEVKYTQWAEIWEQLFNAFDPETGVDYVSSNKGKTIADQRVVDPTHIKRGGCNIT